MAVGPGALDQGLWGGGVRGLRPGADDVVSDRTDCGLRGRPARHPDRTTPGAPRGRAPFSSDANELPSVALTTRFLFLCRQYGSEQLAISIIAAGRSAGVSGLPQGNDWTAWNAGQVRAAVEHLQHKLGL